MPSEKGTEAKPDSAETAETSRDCPKCGESLAPKAKFCTECGTRQTTRVEVEAEDQFTRGLTGVAIDPTAELATAPPILPGDVPQYWLPAAPLALPRATNGARVSVTNSTEAAQAPKAQLLYEPRLLGFAEVLFSDARRGVERTCRYELLAEPPQPGREAAWSGAERIGSEFVEDRGNDDALWAHVPESLNDARKIKSLERSLIDHLYHHAAQTIWHNKHVELLSEPGEDESAFRGRCQEAARKLAEQELAELREKYRLKFEPIDARLHQGERELSDRQETARETEQMLKQGESLFGLSWLWGRKSPPTPAQTRDLKAARKKATQAREDVERQQAMKLRLQTDWHVAARKVAEKWQDKAADVKELRLSPRRADIRITHFGLAWAPFWRISKGERVRLLAAYSKRA